MTSLWTRTSGWATGLRAMAALRTTTKPRDAALSAALIDALQAICFFRFVIRCSDSVRGCGLSLADTSSAVHGDLGCRIETHEAVPKYENYPPVRSLLHLLEPPQQHRLDAVLCWLQFAEAVRLLEEGTHPNTPHSFSAVVSLDC